MDITDAELDDFIVRWENAFGARLTRAEAREEAERLLNFFRLISRPLPEGFKPPSVPSATDQPDAESP
jgi:hypothetical protein